MPDFPSSSELTAVRDELRNLTRALGQARGGKHAFGRSIGKHAFGAARKHTFGRPMGKHAIGWPVSGGKHAFGQPMGKHAIGWPVFRGKHAFGRPIGKHAIGWPVFRGKHAFGQPIGKHAFGQPIGKHAFGQPIGKHAFGQPIGKHAFGWPVYAAGKHPVGLPVDVMRTLERLNQQMDMLGEAQGFGRGELDLAAALRDLFSQCRFADMPRGRVMRVVRAQLDFVYRDPAQERVADEDTPDTK